jgi:hypothetical protein
MWVREARRRWVLIGALASTLSVGACGGHSKKDAEPTASEGGAPAEPTASEGGAPAEPTAECVPYDDTCPPGRYCQYLDGRTQCVAEGDVGRDELCNDGGRCQRGSICLYGSNLYGDSCQQPCDLDQPYGECFIGRHTCFVGVGPDGEELSFGVCRYYAG